MSSPKSTLAKNTKSDKRGKEYAALLAKPARGIASIPCKTDYHQSSGLVQCVVRREMGVTCGPFRDLSSAKFSFSLQTSSGGEIPILVAETKPFSNNYSICSLDQNLKPIGFLSKVRNSVSSIGYALSYHQNETCVTYILYQVPTIAKAFKEAPPRHAQIAASTCMQQDKGNDTNKGRSFQEACKCSIQNCGTLDTLADCDCPSWHVLETKEAYSRGRGQWGLNFNGRGRLPSPKNMQLQDKEGHTTFQMVKWDNNVYNVDFKAPLNMLQAFGVALAQINLWDRFYQSILPTVL